MFKQKPLMVAEGNWLGRDAFFVKGVYYELTLYMDLWNNEIVSHALSAKRGDRMTYINGLKDLLDLCPKCPKFVDYCKLKAVCLHHLPI